MDLASAQEHTGWDELSPAQQALRVLLVAELALALLHMLAVWTPTGVVAFHWVERLHLSQEGNLPTAFAATQLAMLSGVLAHACRHSPSGPGSRVAWGLGALGAAFLAADEWLSIHERLGSRLDAWLQAQPSEGLVGLLQGFPGFDWVLLYLPLVVPVALAVVIRLARELHPRQARRVALGVGLFLLGAVLLDFLDAALTRGDVVLTPGLRALRHGLQLCEELLELVGVTLVLTAFLDHAQGLGTVAAGAPALEAEAT